MARLQPSVPIVLNLYASCLHSVPYSCIYGTHLGKPAMRKGEALALRFWWLVSRTEPVNNAGSADTLYLWQHNMHAFNARGVFVSQRMSS